MQFLGPSLRLNYNTMAMVNLMLDNLRRKATEALLALFKLHVPDKPP